MLLMGMKMSLTKKPTKPMTTNPIAVRAATLVNSASADHREKPSDLNMKNQKQLRFEPGTADVGVLARTLAVRLVATLDEADAVLGEVAEGIHHRIDRVHGDGARSGGLDSVKSKPTRECGSAFELFEFVTFSSRGFATLLIRS
jgi:hypothetical protein